MSPVVSIDRYVCPPWYECPCPLGLPVSRNTMLNHRRVANEKRRAINRGPFGWGPRVSGDSSEMFTFTYFDTLAQHDSDCEENDKIDTAQASIGSFPNQETAPNNSPLADLPQEVCDHGNSRWISSTSPPFVSTSQHIGSIGSISNLEGNDNGNVFPYYDLLHGQGEMELNMEATTRIDGLVEWLKDNKGVVDLFVKHGLEYTVMDDILSLFNAPCRSWKTVVSYITRATSLAGKTQTYRICPGHSCFAAIGHGSPGIAKCSSCGISRPETQSRFTPTLSHLPLLPRLATLISEKETCDQLYVYRHTRETSDGIFAEYFDVAAYKRLVDRYSEEGMKWDIFLAISADGFQPYRNKKYDVWSVIGVLYNLSPALRYATKNVVPLMYIPGPKEPKDLESFFIPLLNEILDVHANHYDGIEMTFYDGETRKVRIHVIWFQGDTPAVSKAAGLCGHKSRHPCRSCQIQGVYVANKKGYYFPSRRAISSSTRAILYEPTQLPDRSVASTDDAFRRLESSRNATQRSAIATDTGIKRRSVLLNISNFVPYKSFPHDTMHLLYNIQREILDLFTGDIDDVFSLNPFSIEIIDNEIMDAGHTISGQLIQRRPQAIGKWKSWKAAEHRSFCISLCMILLDGYLPNEYMEGLFGFVQLVELTCRTEIHAEDAHRVGELSLKFLKHFEKCYYKFQEDRIHFCKSQFHMLLHLEQTIKECGPLVCTSQYVMERSIGFQVDRINAKTRVSEHLFKASLFSESYRLFYRLLYNKESKEFDETSSEGGLNFLACAKSVFPQNMKVSVKCEKNWRDTLCGSMMK